MLKDLNKSERFWSIMNPMARNHLPINYYIMSIRPILMLHINAISDML